MSHFSECRKYLKEKILNRPLEGYEKERSQLSKLMRRTIELNDSNSVLIIGPSGSGKTMLVQSVLDEIKSVKEYDNRYCVVELHGLFHTDDHLAFSDICNQMNVENKYVEDTRLATDTLSTLLQNLSRKDEEIIKSFIFVLEDFHRFCGHDLLYVLFDSAQAKKVPMLVVGVTTHFNVLESLEKRVMSRFSEYRIHLLPECNTFKDRLSKFTEMLTLEKHTCSDSSYIERWNKYIKKLSSDVAVTNVLRKLFMFSKNERLFSNFIFYSISQINEKNPDLTKHNLETAFEMLCAESKVTFLNSLSLLEFCLIIAAHHQTEIYDQEPFNFEMIYQRYHKFAQSSPDVPNVQRQMAYQAFETLMKLELIAPFSTAGTKTVPREYIYHRLLIAKQDIQEAIRTCPNLSVNIQQWAENIS